MELLFTLGLVFIEILLPCLQLACICTLICSDALAQQCSMQALAVSAQHGQARCCLAVLSVFHHECIGWRDLSMDRNQVSMCKVQEISHCGHNEDKLQSGLRVLTCDCIRCLQGIICWLCRCASCCCLGWGRAGAAAEQV